MLIRTIQPRDAAEVARLATQLGYASTTEQIERRLAALAARDGTGVFVADADGSTLAGWVNVTARYQIDSDPDVIVEGLVVDAAYRRRGVGRLLMEAAERWAREGGFVSVRVRSNTVRVEARAFYESLGYRVLKTQNAFRKDLG